MTEINDDFYAESVEKTKSILDEAIAKGHTISDDDRQTLEMVKANQEFAEKVLSGEDYQDLQDFCDTLTVSKIRYINEQIAKGNNKTSFVKKLADIAKDGELAEELRSKPLSRFKEEVGSLKEGYTKAVKQLPYRLIISIAMFQVASKKILSKYKIIFALGGTDAYYLGFNILQNRSTLTAAN